MTRAAARLGIVLSLCGGCRKADAPAEPAGAATASVSASSSSNGGPTLITSSGQDVPGLHVESGVLGQAARWGFSDLALDARRTQLGIKLARGGGELRELLPPGALAVINGGYFESDFRPSTWLVDEGAELAPKSDTSKGGVLALVGNDLYLGPVSGLAFKPTLAVQSFPLLVEAEGKPGVYSDDGRRAARTIACLVGSTLHFIIIAAPRGDGPTLFELATLLREPRPSGFGCRRALNLDGGPSTGVWFAPELQAKQRPPFAKVGYGIVIAPRGA